MDGMEERMSMKDKKLPYPEHADVAREAAVQGIVLLENDGALPLKEKKAALFGAGAIDTVVCGTGSGYVTSPYRVTVKQGLENAGVKITSGAWLGKFSDMSEKANREDKTLTPIDRMWSGITILIDEPEVTPEELEQAGEADTAIYVVRRNTGENFDRRPVKGDYLLSEAEEKNLSLIAAAFKQTIVVLNTCVMDTEYIRSLPGVSALVLLGPSGMEAGNALADVLTGAACPSGRLTDSWALRYEDYPASDIFSVNDGITHREEYREDIYVGYRYFDTFGLDVAYPFGYGLSYTTFDRQVLDVRIDWEQLVLMVKVANTGRVPGQDVVQVYVSAASVRIPKPYQELKGFCKTACLEPGESEVVTIVVPVDSLASYSEEEACYLMEAGRYLVRVGADSRDTEVAAVISLDRDAVVRQVSNCCRPERPFDILRRPEEMGTDSGCGKSGPCGIGYHVPQLVLRAAECRTRDEASKIERRTVTYRMEGGEVAGPGRGAFCPGWEKAESVQTVKACPGSTLQDVQAGRVTMEEFVASLDPGVLVRLVSGVSCETPYPVAERELLWKAVPLQAQGTSGQTTSQYVTSLGIPNAYLSDGPAGLHMPGLPMTGFPSGIVQAQSWNTGLMREIGDCYGREMDHYHVTIALGPGMNIHRDPLCGRNFEYYSEDPLLTGKAGAAFVNGLQQHRGRGVSIKHFCCNNQETDRTLSDSVVTERALREIYLKGFEIAVKESSPMTVMTSYNKLNGTHTSMHYELLTDILRGEWGFKGVVMTDWGTQSDKPLDLHAGNDLIMGGIPAMYLESAVTGADPVLDQDGGIHEETIMEYKAFERKYACWNSFVPDVSGCDTVSVTVPAGTKLAESVREWQEKGIAMVEEKADGSQTVTYRGIRRGAYLALGELQECAARVLEMLLHSAAMEEVRE